MRLRRKLLLAVLGCAAVAARGPVSYGQTTVSGRVIDPAGAAVAGAAVSVEFNQQSNVFKSVTLTDGSFSVALPGSGTFSVTVSARGFATAQVAGTVEANKDTELPDIRLAIADVSTQIQVSASQAEVADEQVHAEEKQRILGLIPNFYVSYNRDTAPLNPKQKFELAWRFTLDPANFAIAGIIAGAEQANNSFSGYGPGPQGYGKRYAAAYGDFLTNSFISNAILPSLLKQDPRYFYKGTGSRRSRILYAIANAVICKGDNGRWQPNYSSILGGLASGGISNAYYPAENRNGASLTFENAGIDIAASAAANIVQEFLFKRLTPGIPKTASTKP